MKIDNSSIRAIRGVLSDSPANLLRLLRLLASAHSSHFHTRPYSPQSFPKPGSRWDR